jgi:hypothetical protein
LSRTVPRKFNGERVVFPINSPGQLDIHYKRRKLDPLPHNIYKNNSKTIINLNVNTKTIREKKCHELGLVNRFLVMTLKAQAKNRKRDKLDFLKISICDSKDTIKKMNRQPTQ